MGANTKIEWTDHTMNPWRGCTKVSDGCRFCYAEMTSAAYRAWLAEQPERAPRDDREHREQVALVEWAQLITPRCPALALLFAIPNGGARHPAVAAKLKAEGVRAGVPDLCLPVARGGFHGLYVELKAAGGRVAPAQQQWHERLRAEGYAVVVAVGWVAAARALCDYLGIASGLETDERIRR